jgi:uncharacterized membrane protein
LNLKLTDRMQQDRYWLRVTVAGRTGEATIMNYELDVEAPRHKVDIKDILLSPSQRVKAGRSLLASVRIKNTGDMRQDGVKVTVKIPELDIQASDYVDKLKTEDDGDGDDQTTSEELWLEIPKCAKPGIYTVRAEVLYNDYDEKVVKETTIEIMEGDQCYVPGGAVMPEEKPVIVIGTQTGNVEVGDAGVVFPLTISNPTSASKSFVMTVSAPEGITSKVSPSNAVIVGAGQTQSVFLYVYADENAKAGAQAVTLTVESDDESKQIPLSVNVVGASDAAGSSSLKKGLEIALVVLVVLLVILGLIIGFNKLKGDEEDDMGDEAKTYY